MRVGDKVRHVTGRFTTRGNVGYFTANPVSEINHEGIIIGRCLHWYKVHFIGQYEILGVTYSAIADAWVNKHLLVPVEESA